MSISPEDSHPVLGDHLGEVGLCWNDTDESRPPLMLTADYRLYLSPLFYCEFPIDKFGRPFKYPPALILSGIIYRHLAEISWRKVPKTYPHYRSLHRYQKIWHKNGFWSLLQLRSEMYRDYAAHERYQKLLGQYECALELAKKRSQADANRPFGTADLPVDNVGARRAEARRLRASQPREPRQSKEQLEKEFNQMLKELSGKPAVATSPAQRRRNSSS